MPPHPAIASTAEIVAEIKAGRMVILVDEEDRENEGDLVMAPSTSPPKRSTSWPNSAAAWSA
jgi:3,4-dihydroxy 2-butanone 4-phosphate synthase/GTP cyclohydrolase II